VWLLVARVQSLVLWRLKEDKKETVSVHVTKVLTGSALGEGRDQLQVPAALPPTHTKQVAV